MTFFAFLNTISLLFITYLTNNCSANLKNISIVCVEDENCVSSLCCYFEDVFGVSGTSYNFQSTIHPAYIRKISFINSSFPEIPAGMFTYFTNLNELDFKNTSLKNTNDYSFNGARLINTLYLSYNHLTKLCNMMFYGAFELGYIDLSHNQLNDVEELAFYGLKMLNSLDLSHNMLKTLPEKCFNSLEGLYSLSLSHNFLDDIQDEMFIDNLFLTKVDFSNNSLTQLDKKIFRYNKNIRILNVADNNLVDVEFLNFMDNNRLEDLTLSNNVLSSFNFKILRTMKNLRKLNISYTGLEVQEIELFGLKNLYLLDLSGNKLNNQHMNTSFTLENLTIMFCNSCGLTTLDYKTVLKIYPNLKYIGIAENEWHCSYLKQLEHNFKKCGIEMDETNSSCTKSSNHSKVNEKQDSCIDELALARIQTKKRIDNRLSHIKEQMKTEITEYMLKKNAELTDAIIKNTENLLNNI